MISINIKKTAEEVAQEKAVRFPKEFYELGCLLNVFSPRQIEAILIALNEKSKRLSGSAKATKNSGYGTANTLEKALKLELESEYYAELASAVAQSSI